MRTDSGPHNKPSQRFLGHTHKLSSLISLGNKRVPCTDTVSSFHYFFYYRISFTFFYLRSIQYISNGKSDWQKVWPPLSTATLWRQFGWKDMSYIQIRRQPIQTHSYQHNWLVHIILEGSLNLKLLVLYIIMSFWYASMHVTSKIKSVVNLLS